MNEPKEDCRCGAFCIEATATTGRVCKLEKQRAAQPQKSGHLTIAQRIAEARSVGDENTADDLEFMRKHGLA